MGMYASKIMSYFSPNTECRYLMLGISGAGKTAILYKLALNKTVNTIPTIGFNVETFEFQKMTITVCDVWKYYLPDTAAIVYVVDSANPGRFEEAKQELRKLLDDELTGAPLLVFANKQDLPLSESRSEMAHALALSSIRNRECHIVGTSAHNGEGLFDGLMWLKKQLNS